MPKSYGIYERGPFKICINRSQDLEVGKRV